MARVRTPWKHCEVCHEARPRESFRVNIRDTSKITVTICQVCRVVQRDITREEQRLERERLRSEVRLCQVCLKERIHWRSTSGRCYRCAMKAQVGVCSRTGAPATYVHKPKPKKQRERAASLPVLPVVSSPPKPPKYLPALRRDAADGGPTPHGGNHPATPAQIKQREKAKAQPWRYLQIADDEWWLRSFVCQSPTCTRRMIAAGKCFTCSTGRERKEKFMSRYERGSERDDSKQDRADEAA